MVRRAWQIAAWVGPELVVVLRYRNAVTCGFHVLLGTLGEHETPTLQRVSAMCQRYSGCRHSG
ncbi:hypothetical protein AMIS_36610 [Actinoplanes missouriensis 431]|uniref:Uncharacterized protein n=1 Tax=Actinoplanes missouriensis (strain ATCC 14538 / DSM 43046 / CBS 188.64 / JCM 3121 / NBRC 102363 / NCIMB 12654 / NRRL B-3342 / UNCC 431) TaxID=512565 RepID=I0H794_ACTM4|nr:hypothetical protein AMIS_36610 [Actinoplanes missouriensis 431]